MQLFFLMLLTTDIFIIVHLTNFTLTKMQQMRYLYSVYDLSDHMNNILKLITKNYYILLLGNDLKKYINCFNNTY